MTEPLRGTTSTALSSPAAPRLRRSLGTPSLLLFGLAYMLPLAVFTTYGIVTEVTHGHLAGAYVVTTVAMLFTAASYAHMVRAYPTAGSAYTYTQKTFGPHLGFLTGWALLLDYLVLPLLNYLIIGLYLHTSFPSIPAWVFVVVSAILVTGLNVVGIRLVSGANLALVGVQLVFVVVFVVVGISYATGHSSTPGLLQPFGGDGAGIGTLMSGAAYLALAFLGFDAISTLSEETRDARRAIPRAIVLCTLVGGLVFVVVAYVAGLVFPDYASFTDSDTASLDLMRRIGGGALNSFFTAAYIAGSFASVITSQASVSRILYAMGRDGQLPRRFFAAVHVRFRTPWLGIGAVGLVGMVGSIVLSLDFVASVINFGALVAFSFVNLAVVKHYAVDEGRRGVVAMLAYVLAPAIGFALMVWLWTSLSRTALIAGLVWVGVGVVILAVVTHGFRRRPPVMDLVEDDDVVVASA
ncbi:putrescine importer [Luteimicrobium album]|uniref:Putrescine importer n=1 Tax=Luteimicrobium album TaxID=1054550 RepID=A0ABQ6HYM0_9MICO|nr:APC family permease [Luteimicrobium album]GMA23502.1 putrescine importer [Luteimicrobium album]